MSARRDEHARLLAEQAEARRAVALIENANNNATLGRTAKPARAQMSVREATLRRRTSRLPRFEVAAAHEVVIETMLSVPQWSGSADRHGMGHLTSFATWVYRNEGYFDPATQMDDARIEAWIDQTYVGARGTSAQAAHSAVRRIRNHRQQRSPQRRLSRTLARSPHTATEWAHYESVAASVANQPVGRSLRMLLDLTGEIGLRADEVIKADGQWIVVRSSQVTVVAANQQGVVREIPAYGQVAARLAQSAGSTELLVLPNKLKSRYNVIDATLRQVNKHCNEAMKGFSVTRARHRWLIHLMQQPIAFPILAAVADINPGSHLLTDLLYELPTIDPRDAATTLRRQLGGQR